jgi:dihydropteroate synthase
VSLFEINFGGVNMSIFRCGRFLIDMSTPKVMGILNLTPDSFYDGGRYASRDAAIRQAERMIQDGADFIDIGGESTRPGAATVSTQEEIDRVVPIVEVLRDMQVPLSIDTSKPDVMTAALAAGADMINDIRAFQLPGALRAVADRSCGLCIMHMQNDPQTMQNSPEYVDVLSEVSQFLRKRVDTLIGSGVSEDRIAIDPGFGFGKSVEHNITLLAGLRRFTDLGWPVLLGISRKSMLGAITGRTIEDRLPASIAAAMLGVARGARIIRVHDVGATVDALKIWHAVEAKII